MKVEPLCVLELRYTGDFHLVRPYGNESGSGWGIGDGTVSGDRLSGSFRWSNHPTRRSDGVMLPNVRGVITTDDGAEVFCTLTGRTVFVERDGGEVGSQLLMTLFESEDSRYSWLNTAVCMTEGIIDPKTRISHFEVFTCTNDLV
jgi:uncharacterized protein DUF3237